jgi:predicted nucleic acid-binding protein
VKLVADANVLLSAVLGGRAGLVLKHKTVEEILTTAFTMGEVQEYAAELARAKRLPLDVVLLAAAALPVTVVERDVYADLLPEAERRVGQRDPDDEEVLALALHLKLPLWSNDRDFEGTGVERFTTAQLLSKLLRESKE